MGRNVSGVRWGSSSSIEIDFEYKGVRCRERIKLIPTPANLRKAQLHRDSILLAIENGTFDYSVTFPKSKNALKFCPDAGYTVRFWLLLWLKHKEPVLKSSTFAGYRKIVNGQLIPALGALRLTELKRSHVRTWVSGLDCSNKRISNMLSPLRSALQDAFLDDLIPVNPLANWHYKKNQPPKQSDVDPFTHQEQGIILAALTGQGKNLIQFAFWSGLRTSELIALRWGDIDWVGGFIRVQRAMTQDASEPETTKTKAGSRDIKLLGPARDALLAQKEYSFLADRQIFLNPRTGKHWIGDQAIRRTLWIPALKKCGVWYRRPYQTRHTFASMMLSSGESPVWVSQQLGHSSLVMTLSVYGRWIPDADINVGDNAVQIHRKNVDGNVDENTPK